MPDKRAGPHQESASVDTLGSKPDSEKDSEKDSEDDLPVVRMSKKRRLQLQQVQQTSTAWDAITIQYPAVISKFFPSQTSIPSTLSIVKYLAALPANHGSLEYNDYRIGGMSFTLELGSKGAVKSEGKYDHFHNRNRVSRSQGNLKAVLAQASGSPAQAPCDRCAKNRGLWKTCMKAANMQGINKTDTLGGSCPNCYYNGAGHICSNRKPFAQTKMAQTHASSVNKAQTPTSTAKKAQPPASSVNMAQTPASSAADGYSSSQAAQAAKQMSQTATASPVASSSSSHQQTVYKPDPSLDEDADDLHQRVRVFMQRPRPVDLPAIKRPAAVQLPAPVQIPATIRPAAAMQLQRLVNENAYFRSEVEKLQAKVEELEDMIEAEDRQS